jgi:uncharacterized protein (TIGR02284 family)
MDVDLALRAARERRTRMQLDSGSIDALEELIHVNIDSHRGFKALSLQIDDADCRNLFREIASKRRDHADLLLRHMHARESEIARHGAFRRALHRWWFQVRTSLDAANTRDLLTEAENGENAVEKCYERVFLLMSDGTVRDVLGAQYREVRRDHHRLHALSARLGQRR